MKRILFGLVASVVMLSVGLRSEAWSQQVPSEAPRVKLYVGEVKGDEDLEKSVRAQLVDDLAERGVALVASEEEADATLIGVGVHRTGTRFMLRTRATVSIVIRGDVQLIARDGRKLWTSDVSSTRWAFSEVASFSGIAANRVAQKIREMAPQMASKPDQ